MQKKNNIISWMMVQDDLGICTESWDFFPSRLVSSQQTSDLSYPNAPFTPDFSMETPRNFGFLHSSCGGFLKWPYPQSSSISNHGIFPYKPSIFGIPPWTPPCTPDFSKVAPRASRSKGPTSKGHSCSHLAPHILDIQRGVHRNPI